MNPDGAEWALLDRYFAGECSARERERVEEWAAAGPEHQAAFDWARTMFSASAMLPRPMWFDRETDAAWHSAAARASVPIVAQPPAVERALRTSWQGPQRTRDAWQSATIAVTAVAFALILGVAVGRRTLPERQTAVREFATAPGQRLTLMLVDGTQFTLAPASRLRVPFDYGRTNRRVALDGEAYFSVIHDAQRPFAVRVRHAVVTDVGTAFDVRTYVGDPAVRVAVAEGEVAIGTEGGRAVHERPLLRARDIATITDTAIAVAHDADIATLTRWTRGELTFTDEPVAAVALELSRWYGVTVAVADPALRARHLTASFTSEPIRNVLQVVARSIGAQYRLHDGVAELMPQSRPAQ